MSKHLIPAQRRERIREHLQTYRVARIADLVEMLGVSEATVRRDLEWLERQGFLERTHGGAILSQRMPLEPEYALRARTHPEEKRQIGAAAAAMIEDGDLVFINSGTTATQVFHYIRAGANITVVTNNVSAVLETPAPGFRLTLVGGNFRPPSNSVAGPIAIATLRQVYASKAFIGVDGISPKFGCTVPSEAEAAVIRVMIERTRGPIVILADHSKWGVVSNYQVATIDQIHTLVTDSQLDPSARAELASRSVRVVIADEKPLI